MSANDGSIPSGGDSCEGDEELAQRFWFQALENSEKQHGHCRSEPWNRGEFLRLCRQHFTAQAGEPVAWKVGEFAFANYTPAVAFAQANMLPIEPLFLAPPSPQPPKGWKLVPESAVEWLKKYNPVLCAKSGLLASAPTPPAAPSQAEIMDAVRAYGSAMTNAEIISMLVAKRAQDSEGEGSDTSPNT